MAPLECTLGGSEMCLGKTRTESVAVGCAEKAVVERAVAAVEMAVGSVAASGVETDEEEAAAAAAAERFGEPAVGGGSIRPYWPAGDALRLS